MKAQSFSTFVVKIFVLATVSVILLGCGNENDCQGGQIHPLRLGFYQTRPGTNRLQAMQIDSIAVVGIGQVGSPIYNEWTRRLRTLELPLRPLADSTGFVLRFGINHTDTLWVIHRHQLHLVSPECGFTVFNTVTHIRHTNQRISGFTLSQPFVANTLEEHLILIISTPTGN